MIVRGLTHEVFGAVQRGNGENFDDCPFSIDGAADVVLQDVVSVGARDAGIFLSGARRSWLLDVQVRDSLADGIHLTNASSSCVVDSPVVLSPGDDGVAVISYVSDPARCSDIRIDDPLVVNGAGRGIAISGGDRVVVTRVDVRRSRGSGVYVASESGQFSTAAVSACRISGGSLDNANWDASLDTGNIGVFALVSGSTVSGVLIEDLSVTGSQKFAAPYIKIGTSNGAGGRFDGLRLHDIVLPQGNRSGYFTCASSSGGNAGPDGTTITSGPAATGAGTTLTRIRQ